MYRAAMIPDKSKEHKYEKKTEHYEHEYELIPVSPLRRLEKRMEDVEKQSTTFDSKEFYRELVEIIRMNQQLVDELAKANDALRIELSRLPSRLEDMISKLDELVSYIKASAGEDPGASPQESLKPLIDKMAEIADSNKKIVDSNKEVMESIENMEKRMKRPLPPPGFARRPPPLFPPKPV